MWTKNSSRFLPTVLARIEKVIPPEVLGRKIAVDDHSTDSTVQIARDMGWYVHENIGNGISDAYKTALNLVSTEFFVSVEHDIILSDDWWAKISKHMRDDKVAVAQGVRVSTHPYLRKLDKYVIERCDQKSIDLCLSRDNNLYRTRVLRNSGIGFASEAFTRALLKKKGFEWVVDRSAVSYHIRPSVRYFVEHDYTMNKIYIARTPLLNRRAEIADNLKLFLFSPFRALHIALKEWCPQVLIVYPIDRLAILKACLEWRSNRMLMDNVLEAGCERIDVQDSPLSAEVAIE